MQEDDVTAPADEFAGFSRRTAMLGALAAGTFAPMAASAAPAAAHAPAAIDPGAVGIPDDPAKRAAIVRRLRYRTDAGVLMWWFRGRIYGQKGADLFPICGMLFGSMIKLAPRSDGGFDVLQYELGFRTDFETGRKIDRLRNPLTGEMIDIPFAPVGPTRVSYSADNTPTVPTTLGGSMLTYEHKPEQFWTAGDTLFMQYHARSKVETQGKPDRVINDFGMVYGSLAEALDPKVKSARAWVQGNDITDYARWLKMPADAPGSQTLRSIGAKVHDFKEMPADWRAAVAEADPAMAADPMSVFSRSQAIYKG